eukprot:3515628-Rhodomonas_salina.1
MVCTEPEPEPDRAKRAEGAAEPGQSTPLRDQSTRVAAFQYNSHGPFPVQLVPETWHFASDFALHDARGSTYMVLLRQGQEIGLRDSTGSPSLRLPGTTKPAYYGTGAALPPYERARQCPVLACCEIKAKKRISDVYCT